MNRHHFAVTLSLALTTLLTGCNLTGTAAPSGSLTVAVAGPAIQGKVHGGQQPIASAKIYLLAANPAGYGNTSLSLLTSATTGNGVDSIGAYTLTDSGGNFNVASDYSCTTGFALGAGTSSGGTTLSGSEQVYLYALGGNSGSGTNSSIGLLAALGPCDAQFTPGLIVNEITTIATTYAFAGYATDATHLSSSGSALALTGLTNAGLNYANLVSNSQGMPVPSDSTTTRPTASIITLANILAACINSTGSGACSTLFAYAQSSGATGTPPTDTATAAINIAHNPWPGNVGGTALYNLASATPPFAGGLTSQPNDFTLGMNYTGGGLNNPFSVVIDASGNAWLANYNGGYGNSLSGFSSTGVPLSVGGFTGTNTTGLQWLAIDPSGRIWGTTFYSHVSVFSSSGQFLQDLSGVGGIAWPFGIAFDPSGNAWISDYGGGCLSEFNSSGVALSGSNGISLGQIGNPLGLAVDASGAVWTANWGSGTAIKYIPANGTYAGYSNGASPGEFLPMGVAIDHSGDAWITNFQSGSYVVEFTNSGSLLSPSGSGWSPEFPQRGYVVAIDGAGNAWTSNDNSQFGGIAEFNSTGTLLSPYYGWSFGQAGSDYPTGLAIDGSGDVWLANSDNSSVTELIGAATPVVTPIVANLLAPYNAPASKP